MNKTNAVLAILAELDTNMIILNLTENGALRDHLAGENRGYLISLEYITGLSYAKVFEMHLAHSQDEDFDIKEWVDED